MRREKGTRVGSSLCARGIILSRSRGVKPRSWRCSAQDSPHGTATGCGIKGGPEGPPGHGILMDSNTWTHFAALVILAFATQPAGAEPDASPDGPQLAQF